jgi:signal transduction histidine kinase
MIALATALGLLVQGALYPANLDALFLLVVFVIIAVTTSELVSRAHDLLREQSARARAEALVHAKEALLNRIAHELRQPLTPIQSWVQILRLSGGDAQRTARGLAGVERNAELLARLVNDLLDASRIHAGKLCVQRKRIVLAPVIERSLEDATIAAAEKGVTLRCALEPVGTVLADEHRIEQVVGNLVSNALKFTPADGRITVSLSKAGALARLVVADSGEGIPREFIPHVFEPFSQAKAGASVHTPGLGLGLAIVKHLVDAHEGRISVVSDGLGQGTSFVVELPLEGPSPETPATQGTERAAEDSSYTTGGT